MGFFCKCKNCGELFVDMYGEFVNKDGYLECPECHSEELLIDDEIPEIENENFKDIDDYHESELNKEAADNSVDNLMPSCRMCNYYKNTYNIEGFRNRLETTLMENVRRPFDYRLGIKYGLIKEDIKPIKFYFEEYITK